MSKLEHCCADCGEPWHACRCWMEDDVEFDDDERYCTRCGGEGRQEGTPIEELCDDWGEIPCKACGGSGLAKDQTIW